MSTPAAREGRVAERTIRSASEVVFFFNLAGENDSRSHCSVESGWSLARVPEDRRSSAFAAAAASDPAVSTGAG